MHSLVSEYLKATGQLFQIDAIIDKASNKLTDVVFDLTMQIGGKRKLILASTLEFYLKPLA